MMNDRTLKQTFIVEEQPKQPLTRERSAAIALHGALAEAKKVAIKF